MENAPQWHQLVIREHSRQLALMPDDTGWFRSRNHYERDRRECLNGLLRSLEQSGQWEEYARLLEAEAMAHPMPEHRVEKPRICLDEAALGFPHILTRWPADVNNSLGVDYDRDTLSRQAANAAHWIPLLRDPWLKLVAQRQHGDAKAAREEMDQRLASPSAGLREWWIGAWFAWEAKTEFPDDASEQAATQLAAERLAKASEFKVEGEARIRLDAALVRAVLALRHRSVPLLYGAREAAKRLRTQSLSSTYEREQLRKACELLGFSEEAVAVDTGPEIPSIAETMNYEPLETSLHFRTTARLLQQNGSRMALSDNDAIATRQLLRSARLAAVAHPYRGGTLIEEATIRKLLDPLLVTVIPSGDATAREHWLAGLMFKLLNQPERAKTEHETALRLEPGLDEARISLTALSLPDDKNAALEYMKALPPECAIKCLDRPIFWSWDAPHDNDLATRWLEYIEAAKLKLPDTSDSFDNSRALQELIFHRPTSPTQPGLWRAAAKHPSLVQYAICAMAEDALRRNQPLAEVAKLARAYLNAKNKSGFQYGRQISPRALPLAGVVTETPPLLIVIWDAWQRNSRTELDDLAALKDTEARLGAELFFCHPDQFTDIARAFVRSDKARTMILGNAFTDRFSDGGTLDFISLVWQLRQFKMPLENLFLEEAVRLETADSSLEAFANYLNLAGPITSPEELLRSLRDKWVSPDPARRITLLKATQERSEYEQPQEYWPRTLKIPKQVKQYASFLRKMLEKPRTCRAALRLADEDGLMSNQVWLANSQQFQNLTVDTKPDELLSLMEGYSLLGNAGEFRTWGTNTDPSSSIFTRATNALFRSEEVWKTALKLLKTRKPSFGRDLILSWHEHYNTSDEAARFSALALFVTNYRKEFSAIPTHRWPEIAPLFRNMTVSDPDVFGQRVAWQLPWTLHSPAHPKLAPLAEIETRYLLSIGRKVMTLEHWENLHRSGYEFCELTAHCFIILARKDRPQAIKLADHVLGLLALPSKRPGPRDGSTPTDLLLEWIAGSAQTQEAVAAIREVMATSKTITQDDPGHRAKLESVLTQAEQALLQFKSTIKPKGKD
jgi:hypothetical protein